jgi:predicted RNA-binding protein associated with RNAse of E/G family
VSSGDRVRIHYRRLPDRERIFDQRVVLVVRDDVTVTLSEPLELPEPMLCGGRVMLEHGSLALWFTYPGEWHDIGIFHRADGAVTGLYANILTPPEMDGDVWHTTDLFLDLWWPEGGEVQLLDEDELAQALESGDIDPETARKAQVEADRLMGLAQEGAWPPPVVREWTLERASEALQSSFGTT